MHLNLHFSELKTISKVIHPVKDNSLVILTEGLTCWTQRLIHQLGLHSSSIFYPLDIRQFLLWDSSGLLFFMFTLQKPGLLSKKKTMQPKQTETFYQAGNFLGRVSGIAKLNFTEE